MWNQPEFWQANRRHSLKAQLLRPIAALYGLATKIRNGMICPATPSKPVICIGNVIAGGAGKTPVAIAVAKLIQEMGKDLDFLSRGYGGKLTGPVLVQPDHHQAMDVGDEPLLLAQHAPTTVSADRLAGLKLISNTASDLVIMDDGFQNPSIQKTVSILVIDDEFNIGNGLLFPAGPLREPLAAALARSDAVVLLGGKEFQERIRDLYNGPIFLGNITAKAESLDLDKSYIAFAGIGRPIKFKKTLEKLSADVIEFHAFPDHHPYRETELKPLMEKAASNGYKIITTEKDFVRLPESCRNRVDQLPVIVSWDDVEAVRKFVGDIKQ